MTAAGAKTPAAKTIEEARRYLRRGIEMLRRDLAIATEASTTAVVCEELRLPAGATRAVVLALEGEADTPRRGPRFIDSDEVVAGIEAKIATGVSQHVAIAAAIRHIHPGASPQQHEMIANRLRRRLRERRAKRRA